MAGGVPDRELSHEISLCYAGADDGILTFRRNFLAMLNETVEVPQKGFRNGLVLSLVKCTPLWPSPSSSHRDTVNDTTIDLVVDGCVLLQVQENIIIERMLK